MRPEPIRRKGRKTLAKIYDSLTDPEKAPDRSRIIGLPTKKEARDIRDELTAAAWAGGGYDVVVLTAGSSTRALVHLGHRGRHSPCRRRARRNRADHGRA